jgi:hypothetical protein
LVFLKENFIHATNPLRSSEIPELLTVGVRSKGLSRVSKRRTKRRVRGEEVEEEE